MDLPCALCTQKKDFRVRYAHERLVPTLKVGDSYLPDGQLGATLRSLCRALSLNFSGQLQHIRRRDALNSALVRATATTQHGKREVTVLLIWAIPIWLTELQSTRLGSAKQEVILLLQRQAVQAIYGAFWGTQVRKPLDETAIPISQDLAERLDRQEALLENHTARLAASERLLAATIERLLEHERRLNRLKPSPAPEKRRPSRPAHRRRK